MPEITVILTQTQHDVFDILPGGRQKWVDDAVKNKANTLIDVLVQDYSDKQPQKISDAEKEIIVSGIDLAKEKDKRIGKK